MDWISVKDRLPLEKDEKTSRIVLAVREDLEIFTAFCVREKGWHVYISDVVFNDVTHWRELPRLPDSYYCNCQCDCNSCKKRHEHEMD